MKKVFETFYENDSYTYGVDVFEDGTRIPVMKPKDNFCLVPYWNREKQNWEFKHKELVGKKSSDVCCI